MLRKSTGTLALILFAFHSHAASISGQGTWETTLQARDLDGNGSTTEAYYDTDLNITWIADANLAATNTFGITGINGDGGMSWYTANGWIAAMNTGSYLGVSDWRLPTMTDTGAPGCDFAYSGTDCGLNVDLTAEIAHMFYSTLGNAGFYDTSGVPTSCSTADSCLTNEGPFSNVQSEYYWYGLAYASTESDDAWAFDTSGGNQDAPIKSGEKYSWAVHDGDIGSPVPIPAAAWLLGSALGVLGWVRRHPAA